MIRRVFVRRARRELASKGGGAVLAAGLLLAASASAQQPRADEPCRGLSLSDVTELAGVAFAHSPGGTGDKHLPETMGAGLAWLDLDGDGWLDLYLVQSGPFPPSAARAAEAANRLWRNRGDGTFEPLPQAADLGYGQGATAADVDGDGDPDLYVTNYGPDRLWLNENGRFAEPRETGVGGWSSSAAFADADLDGDLDLYVSRYVEYDPAAPLSCGEEGARTYCDPSLFEGAADRYLRNEGGGRFVDATAEAGLTDARGRGLGVLFTDLDGDGAPDLYVANDLTLNGLYRNRGQGQFDDESLFSGAAVNVEGKPEAGMGLAVGDLDGDGDPDLGVTNFDVETNTLYRNLGGLQFEDASAGSGFGLPSFNLLGFGLIAEDLDLDGDLDVYAANGHIFQTPRRSDTTYRQPDLLLLGDGAGNFEAARCGPAFELAHVGRGLAAADFDNDGDTDLGIVNSDGPFQLLATDPGPEGATRWLGLRLVGRAPNTEAIGATVTLTLASGKSVTRWVTAGDSYQSSSDKRLRFGLGDSKPEHLEVRWPSGNTQRWGGLSTGRYLTLFEPQ